MVIAERYGIHLVNPDALYTFDFSQENFYIGHHLDDYDRTRDENGGLLVTDLYLYPENPKALKAFLTEVKIRDMAEVGIIEYISVRENSGRVNLPVEEYLGVEPGEIWLEVPYPWENPDTGKIETYYKRYRKPLSKKVAEFVVPNPVAKK